MHLQREFSGHVRYSGPALLGWLIAVMLLANLTGSCQQDNIFQLREYLGHNWQHECVRFPLTLAQVQQAKAGQALVGQDGQPIAYQIVPADGMNATIEFLVDLPPYETRTYAFAKEKIAVKTDLTVTETADTIQLANAVTGIRIRKALMNGNGPIERIRLQSGKWIGGSRLTSDLPLTGYTAALVTNGSVFAEVVCTAKLGDQSTWELRFRLNAGEPVVLIDETSAVAGNGSTFKVDLQQDFDPKNIFHRRSYPNGFSSVLSPLKAGMAFLLEPWQNWYQLNPRGACFSLCTVNEPALNPEGGQPNAETIIQPDLLSVAAREAGVWVNPDLPKEKPQAPPCGLLMNDNEGLHLDFALKYGQRKWMISALNAEQSLRKEKDQYPTAPLPYQYLIKHGQFPLNTVKNYVLSWDQTRAQYPHLLYTQGETSRFRARLSEKTKADYLQRIPDIISRPIDRYYLGPPIEAWFITGDERLARHIITGAERRMQDALDNFLVQPVPYGSAPHMTPMLGDAMTLADTAIGTGLLTQEQRERLLAKAAFVAYAINRPDYWSPARGYSGNPNMSTSVFGYLNSAACLLNTHPQAKAWSTVALTQLTNQLHGWSDDGGGWLEAPHYAMVSYDPILGALIMANNAGFSDALYTDPKVKTIINWFSKISTPPDTRIGGIRHLPCIGNTYMYEPTGAFGILAYLFRDKDPEFAAQMQWMFRQQKSYGDAGIGSGYPAMAGYRSLLLDPTIPEKAPAWKSEWFPKTGVVLHSGFPNPRETQLYMIAGSNHDHYDHDSGSITLWGKGRIVADDYGYNGRAPADDHNLVQSPVTGGIMQVQQFATFPAFDYVSGLAGGWRRQIAFLKDADVLGPNYFVLCDSFAQPQSATWRLWLTAADVTLRGGDEMVKPGAPVGLEKENADLLEEVQSQVFKPSQKLAQRAVAVGKDDVETDIFFTRPDALLLRTEERTRRAGSGLQLGGSWGPITTTQIGLIADVKDCPAITTVIYPRLKTEKPPVFTSIAGGAGVKVQHAAGTDYVFVSPAPVTFREGDLTFEGTVGTVMLRGKKTVLSLGAAGNIAARRHTLAADAPKVQEWTD